MTEPPEKSEKTSDEHRAGKRRRVLLTGKLVYSPTNMTQDCAISDMSQSGARVRLQGPEPLLDPIYLIDVLHGLAFEAKQVWRRGNLAGLSFVRYFDLRTAPPDPAIPPLVRRIWVEQTR